MSKGSFNFGRDVILFTENVKSVLETSIPQEEDIHKPESK